VQFTVKATIYSQAHFSNICAGEVQHNIRLLYYASVRIISRGTVLSKITFYYN